MNLYKVTAKSSEGIRLLYVTAPTAHQMAEDELEKAPYSVETELLAQSDTQSKTATKLLCQPIFVDGGL